LGYEPGFQDAITFALELSGEKPTGTIEVMWAEMETRSMAQGADAAVKLTAGTNPVISTRLAAEKFVGLSPEEIARDEQYRAEQQAQLDIDAILASVNPQAGQQNPQQEQPNNEEPQEVP
jgi:hypothetical protein